MALKLLPFQGPIDATLVRVFEESAEAAGRIDHPHLTHVREYGVTSTLLWYATESVRARSLAATLKVEGPLPLAEVSRMVEQSRNDAASLWISLCELAHLPFAEGKKRRLRQREKETRACENQDRHACHQWRRFHARSMPKKTLEGKGNE